jgi:hypothetical protein
MPSSENSSFTPYVSVKRGLKSMKWDGDCASFDAINRNDKRHVETRSLKADVFPRRDQDMPNFPNMDAAAEATARKLVPASFRTVRGWIGEWKKPRSASTT